jgi:hypothetical protein
LERHVPADHLLRSIGRFVDLRGLNGARDEFLLAATAQKLRNMAKLIPMPVTPTPA